MDNLGSSTTGNKPAARKTATSTTPTSTGTRTTGTRTTGTGTTGTATNANPTRPGPRVVNAGPPGPGPDGVQIVVAEPRSRPGATGSATRPPPSPSVSSGMSSQTLDNIVGRLATALGDKSYAIIGNAAQALLRIGPPGNSVDVLVPTGTPSKRAEKLCTSRTTNRFKFVASKGVFYVRESGGKDIPITFWEPKEVNQQCPESMTVGDLVMVGDVRVLKPTLLLNIYCYNWLKSQERGRQGGNGAAQSIDLLLKHIAKETKKEVSNATGEFLIKFAAAKPEAHAGFRDLGILGPH